MTVYALSTRRREASRLYEGKTKLLTYPKYLSNRGGCRDAMPRVSNQTETRSIASLRRKNQTLNLS